MSIRWPAVDAPDIHRYVVMRAPGGSTDFERIGTTAKLLFTDTSVTTGASYDYAVVAEDTGFNRSPLSPVLSVDARQRVVQVTFQVKRPGRHASRPIPCTSRAISRVGHPARHP